MVTKKQTTKKSSGGSKASKRVGPNVPKAGVKPGRYGCGGKKC